MKQLVLLFDEASARTHAMGHATISTAAGIADLTDRARRPATRGPRRRRSVLLDGQSGDVVLEQQAGDGRDGGDDPQQREPDADDHPQKRHEQ